MYSAGIHDIMMDEINLNGINLDNIIYFSVKYYFNESTFLPIVYMYIGMVDGEKHEVSLDMTRELVQDIIFQGRQDNSVNSTADDFNKRMLRRTNLNKILNERY